MKKWLCAGLTVLMLSTSLSGVAFAEKSFVPDPSRPGQVEKIGHEFWLKNDGTVWRNKVKMDMMSDIIEVDAGFKDSGFAALSRSGELYYWLENGNVQLLGVVPDAQSIHVDSASVLVLHKDGRVSHHSYMLKGESETIATDVVHVVWGFNNSVMLTKKDGTVWREKEGTLFQLEQVKGLENIVETRAADEDGNFAAKKKDGTWTNYTKDGAIEQEVTEEDLNPIVGASLNVGKKNLVVGEQVYIGYTAQYQDETEGKFRVSDSQVTFDKPHLLEELPSGSYKALGVGEVTVTLNVDGKTDTEKVTISLNKPLQKAANIDGTVYLPLQTTFQHIGGTVTYDKKDKRFNVKLGPTTISLQKESAVATVNGKTVTMKGKVRDHNGVSVFPASLLTQTMQAQVSWDKAMQQAVVKFGQAKMTIQSDETAKIVKKKQQGNLVKFIGRTYWVNEYSGWERFSKVTVTDVIPNANGDAFTIQFKNAKGKTLQSLSMSAEDVGDELNNKNYFTNYDPYKKYKWSSKIWSQIKQGKVSVGMNKDQVRMSWGEPDKKSTLNSKSFNIETWSYGSLLSYYKSATFTNGKVTSVYHP